MISDKALVQSEILHMHGVTYGEIAAMLGVTPQALFNRRKKNKDYIRFVREKVSELMVINEYDRISNRIIKESIKGVDDEASGESYEEEFDSEYEEVDE